MIDYPPDMVVDLEKINQKLLRRESVMARAVHIDNGHEFRFIESDIVNIDDFIPEGEYNPHNVHPWLLHDHGFTVCVVFASSLQDALDVAVDEGRLDRFQVSDEEFKSDYDSDEERVSFLGGWKKFAGSGIDCEMFDIDSLGCIELPNPKFSFCKLFVNEKM